MEPDAIVDILRKATATTVDMDEVAYVAELVHAAHEEQDVGGDRQVLHHELVDVLEPLGWWNANDLEQVVKQLVAAFCGEEEKEEASSDEEENEASRQRAQYAIGATCLVVLEEDEEWHPARIVAHVENDEVEVISQVRVEFVEYGKQQVVDVAGVVLEQDVADAEDEDALLPSECELCHRVMHITLHHLIPRVTHPKYLKKGYTREFLNTCARLCRQCHSKIHSTEDNKTLAREYNTLDKLLAHPDIRRWVEYARKQRSHYRPRKKCREPRIVG